MSTVQYTIPRTTAPMLLDQHVGSRLVTASQGRPDRLCWLGRRGRTLDLTCWKRYMSMSLYMNIDIHIHAHTHRHRHIHIYTYKYTYAHICAYAKRTQSVIGWKLGLQKSPQTLRHFAMQCRREDFGQLLAMLPGRSARQYQKVCDNLQRHVPQSQVKLTNSTLPSSVRQALEHSPRRLSTALVASPDSTPNLSCIGLDSDQYYFDVF